MRPCLIVDVTDAWNQAPYRPEGCELIPHESRPTVKQPDRATAEKEALRLAGQFPSRRFAIFEAVAMASTVEVPTHVSLDGKAIFRGRMPVLAFVDVDDGVPF